jgi:hypothetical protein
MIFHGRFRKIDFELVLFEKVRPFGKMTAAISLTWMFLGLSRCGGRS